MKSQSIPPVGLAEDIGDSIRRILAPNPSPMTLHGTNTYLVGYGDVAVIDPGPDDAAHLQAILASLHPNERITHILVTHAHRDHSPLARTLSNVTGAPVYAYGGPEAGRSKVMEGIALSGALAGGEGVDRSFAPDITLTDTEIVSGSNWTLKALWTPGHFGNHLCFQMGDVVFAGDLVMGWASSLVSPPDGDLTDFMSSCRRLQTLNARIMHSGHGDPIVEPAKRLDWLIAHRTARETAILKRLQSGPATANELARAIYTDTPKTLMRAATRNVLAHLIDLYGKKQCSAIGKLSSDTTFFC